MPIRLSSLFKAYDTKLFAMQNISNNANFDMIAGDYAFGKASKAQLIAIELNQQSEKDFHFKTILF